MAVAFATAAALLAGMAGSAQATDVPLSTTLVTNGQVNVIAHDASGRAYVGGSFNHVGPRLGSGAVFTGSSDIASPAVPDINGTVYSAVSDGAGGEFIGGDFLDVGGVPRARLAHILADGTLDPDWNPGANGRVFALALSPSGESLYVAGWFEAPDPSNNAPPSIGDQDRDWLAKIRADTGTVDPDWNPAPDSGVSSLAASDSSVYVSGGFANIGGVHSPRLAKLDASGTGAADPSWTPVVALGGPDWVSTLALAGPDLYVGGRFEGIGGLARSNLAKLDSGGTGAVDPTWDPSPDGPVDDLQLSGGDLFVAGTFRTIGGQAVSNLAKLSRTGAGAADATWKPADSQAFINAIGMSGGDLVVGGIFNSRVGGASGRRFLAKLSTTGTGAATAWDPNPNGAVYAFATSGSRLFVGGEFSSYGAQNEHRGGLIRLNADGSLDRGWDPQVGGGVKALSLAGNELIVGGGFRSVRGEERWGLVKLSTEGSGDPDPVWSTELDPGGSVSALARSGDSVFVGGQFGGAGSIGGADREDIAKLSAATGAVDPAWNPGADDQGPDEQVFALALSGSDLFVGGFFADMGGQPLKNVAKLSTTGSGAADPDWHPQPNSPAASPVAALLVSGPSIYAGGYFHRVGARETGSLVKLSTEGSGGVDAAWTRQPDEPVLALALNGGDLYAGGFSSGDFARLSASTGVRDPSFAPATISGSIHALAVHGNRLLVGGGFGSIGPLSIANFAIFDITPPGGPPTGSTDEPHPEPDTTAPPTGPAITTGPQTPPLVISALAIKRPRFAAKRGTRVSYRLSSRARVTFTITRGLSRVGRFTLRGEKGTNRFTFRGRVRGKTLKPGRYLIAARAEAGRLSSKTVARQFRVLRR